MKKKFLISGILVLVLILAVVGFFLYLPHADYCFSREISPEERSARLEVVRTAESWLGARESDGSHQPIIDLYNSHEPLAQGYLVSYDDNWCATFVSCVAIECGITDILPTECSCQRQIGLWQDLGQWEEDDTYLPLPGDIIYYDWDVRTLGDSTGWSDHVGIVVGTWGPFIKVIEGNKDDAVTYRYLNRLDLGIRGYGLPDYSSLCE